MSSPDSARRLTPSLVRRLGPLIYARAPFFISMIDREHRITLANEAFEGTFGVQSGKACYTVYKGREEICECCSAAPCFAQGIETIGEERGKTAGGQEICYKVQNVPVFDDQGQVEYVLQMALDTTALRELEQGLEEAERLARVGLTTAGLAHTIKNILAGLEGGIYVVDSGLKRDDQERLTGGWSMVKGYIEQVSVLVKNLLRYARAGSSERKEIEPAKITEDVIQLFETKAALTQIELQAEVEPDLAPLLLDPEAIHACLSNLVANALDACTWDPDSDKVHRIVVRVMSGPRDGVVFEVEDNGMGISDEHKAKILSAHFTTKGIRGTGLGLLLTKKAVADHGGEISFSSVAGQGSTFRIELPRLPAAVTADQSITVESTDEGAHRKKENT